MEMVGFGACRVILNSAIIKAFRLPMPGSQIFRGDKFGHEKESRASVFRTKPAGEIGQNSPSNAMHQDGSILGLTREYSGWDVYNNEAKKVDMELVKDWTASLNFLLLFAAIFAAVLTAFIIESKKMLEPDNTTAMLEVMIFYTNSLANGSHTLYAPTPFQASPTDITINCLFFASLSASLVAALASVVSLQWVADYDAAITRGGSSPEDRAKRRQFRYAGVVGWKMSGIIAALPLLLYFSVIIFFLGLILWMWNVNSTVGAVVGCGAATAVLFYGASTFIAVVYTSAPFRTPLSRWIYSLCLLPLSIIYRLVCAIDHNGGIHNGAHDERDNQRSGRQSIPRLRSHFPNLASWLEQQHLTYITSHKREDLAVENRKDLGKDALVWLANQLSISPDSYRRLLLLVGELPRLDPGYLPAFDSKEASWYWIFDLLGWRYLNGAQMEDMEGTDMQEMAILQKCHAMPAVQQLTAPAPRTNYVTDLRNDDYWMQYCDATDAGNWNADFKGPNRLFLLIRDTPTASEFSTQELRIIMRLSRWRNQKTRTPQLWSEKFTAEKSLPPRLFNSCVLLFSKYASTQSFSGEGGDNVNSCLSIIRNIAKIVVTRGDLLAHVTIQLIQAYESLLIGYNNTAESTACITNPRLYGRTIRLRTATERLTHESMILLLSRQLRTYPATERSNRVWEVIVMLWLRPSNPAENNWEHLRDGVRDLQGLSPTLVMDWIKKANDIPDIIEILRHMAIAQRHVPEIGPLWRATVPDQFNNPRFIEALWAFDNLIGADCTWGEHHTLIDLVCLDFQQQMYPDFEGYFTPSRLQLLALLRDPCLQTLADSARGFDFVKPIIVLDEYRSERRASWGRIERYLLQRYPNTNSPALLRLQASLWPMSSTHKAFCKLALQNSDTFVSAYSGDLLLVSYGHKSHLGRIFHYPVTCAQCHDGPGHLFFHILDALTRRNFPKNLDLFSWIPLMGRSMKVIPIILCLMHFGEPVLFQNLLGPVDKDNLHHLNTDLQTIAGSEYHLLTLILNVSGTSFGRNNPAESEELGAILVGVEKALHLPPQPGSTCILAPLSSRILFLREPHLAGREPLDGRSLLVANEALKTSQLLLSRLATRTVFGSRNNRLLSCALARGEIGPALGWLPPHLDR